MIFDLRKGFDATAEAFVDLCCMVKSDCMATSSMHTLAGVVRDEEGGPGWCLGRARVACPGHPNMSLERQERARGVGVRLVMFFWLCTSVRPLVPLGSTQCVVTSRVSP